MYDEREEKKRKKKANCCVCSLLIIFTCTKTYGLSTISALRTILSTVIVPFSSDDQNTNNNNKSILREREGEVKL